MIHSVRRLATAALLTVPGGSAFAEFTADTGSCEQDLAVGWREENGTEGLDDNEIYYD